MLQDWKLQVSALLLVILSVSHASPARVANAYNFILPPEAGKTSASRTIINAQAPRAPSFFRNVQQQQETISSQVTQQVQGPSEWPAESTDGQPVSQQKIEIGSEANLVQQQLQAREEESQRKEEQERVPLETVSSSADGQVKEEQPLQSSPINSHFGGFGSRKSRPRPLLVPQAAVFRQEQVRLLPQAETNVRIEQQQIQQPSVQQEVKGVPSSQPVTVVVQQQVQQKVEAPAESNPAMESFLRGTTSQGSVSLPPLQPQQVVVVQQTEAPLAIPSPPSTTTITFLQPSSVQQQIQPARAAESSAQVQFSQSLGSIGQVQEQSQVRESIGQVQESVGQIVQQKIQGPSEVVQTQAQPTVQFVQQQPQQFQNIYYQPPEAEVRQIVQVRQPDLKIDQRPVVDASSVQITQQREQAQQSQEQQQVTLQEPPRAESTGSAQVQSQVLLGDVQQKEEQQVQQQKISLPSQSQVSQVSQMREVSVPEESRILDPSPPPQPVITLVQPGQEPPREIRKQLNLVEQDPNKQSVTFTKVTVTDTLLPETLNGVQPQTPNGQPNVQVDSLNQVTPQGQAQVQQQFLVQQVPTQAPQQQITLQQNVQPQQLFLLRPVQQGPQLQQQFGGQLFFINNGQNGNALTNQQLILSPVQGPPQTQGVTYFLQPQPQQILQLAPQQPQQRLPETLLQLKPQPQPPQQQTFVQFQSQPQPQPPQQSFVQIQQQPPQPQIVVQPQPSPIQNQVSVSEISNTIPTPPPQPPQVIYTEVTRQTEQTPPPQPPLITLTQVTRQPEIITPPPQTTVGVEYMERDNVQVKEEPQQETKGQVQPKEESRESGQAVDIPQVKEQAVKGDIVPEAPSTSQLAISRPQIPERPPPLPQAVKGSEPRPQQVKIPEESVKSVRPASTIPEGRKIRQPLAPLLPRRPEATKSTSQTIQIKEIGEAASPQEEVDFQRFPDLMASGHLQEDLLRINKPASAEKSLPSNRLPSPPQRLVPVKTRAPQSPRNVLRDIRVNTEAPITEMYDDRTLEESSGKQRIYRVSSPSTIRIPSLEVVTQSNSDEGFGDEQRRVPVDSEESRKVQLPLAAVKTPVRVTTPPEVVEQIQESLSSVNLQPVIQTRLQSPDELQFRPQYLSSLSSEVSSNYGAQQAPAKRLRRVQRPRRYRLNAASGQRFGSLDEATRALTAQQRAGRRHRRQRPVASEN